MKASSPFAHRKARNAKDLGRKGVAETPSYARILIVCEGTKTEPHYFEAFRSDYRHQLKAIVIESGGSAPISNVETAEELYREDLLSVNGDTERAYEAVFCVFDRDTHPTFDKAMIKINALKAGLPIHAIASYPCFEFWLILHFGFTRSPFAKTSKKSIGDVVKKKLQDFPGFKGYKEREKNAYALTKEKLPDCIKHSRKAVKNAIEDNESNPSTHIHVLVEYLLGVVRDSLVAARKKLKLNSGASDSALTEINALEWILGMVKTT